MKKFHLIIITFICLLLFTSCNEIPSAILNDVSCQAPCWRNISMGMSKDDVISLLNYMKDIQKSTIKIKPTYKNYWDEGVSWDFAGRQENYGEIFFHHGKVVMMYFEEKGITLSKLIQKYDVPDQVWAVKDVLDSVMLTIDFTYPGKGVCYEYQPSSFSPRSIDSYRITSSNRIMDIYYFDPTIELGQYNIGCIWSIDKSLIQEWKGYGDYAIYLNK